MEQTKRKQIHEITAIKGICALIIAFLYHPLTVGFTNNGRLPFDNIRFISFFQQNGGIMVELFIMLSGFLSWTAYSDKISRSAASGDDMYSSFLAFLKRRLIRIFPLMWFTLLMTVIMQVIHLKLTGVFFVVPNNSSSELLYNLMGLQLFWSSPSWNAPAWTLNKLLICWVLFFFIVWKSKGNKSKAFTLNCAMIIIGLALVVKHINYDVIPLIDFASGRAYLSFFIGCNLSMISRKLTSKRLGVICLVLLIINCLFILIRLICGAESFSYEPYYVSFPIIVFPLIILGSSLIKPVSAALKPGFFQFLGKISFSVYLCNFPLEILISLINEKAGLKLDYSSPSFFFINAAVQLLAAIIVWWLVENKLTGLLKKEAA